MPRTTLPEHSLAATRPDLVAELDLSRHPDLDVRRLATGSHRKLWWRCEHGHGWEASVKNRVRLGSGCPRCADARRWLVARDRSLAARFPELAAELDRNRNGDLDPWTLPPATRREVWWRGCGEGHPPWRARPWYRIEGSGCPYCAGTSAVPERSLAAHPELMAQLDPELNGDLNPQEIPVRGGRELWWRCRQGHVWQAPVSRRLKGSQCPYCSGLRVTRARSLAAHPQLARELDPVRNGDLHPAAVAALSDRRLWWRCQEGHVWEAVVKSRVKVGAGCPTCAPRGRRGIPLAVKRPELIDEWVEQLNGGGPDEVMAGSEKKVWWRCSENPAHLWRAMIRNRVRQHSGCPYCAHTRVARETSLAATRPDLAAQWHPERNGALSPSDVLPGAKARAWWRCARGHAWEASPSTRTAGHGCPDCAAERRAAHYEADRSRLEPLRRWAAEHGTAPSIREWRAAGLSPNVSTYIRRFGSWNAAIRAAGLEPRPRVGGIRSLRDARGHEARDPALATEPSAAQ